jgi:hypothetical protein
MRLKAIPHRTLPYGRTQRLGELRHDGHVATLPAFGFRNQDHLLIKKHILRFAVHKLKDPCPV